ncbi:MAG TPA: hypothetical protein VGR50_01105 [Terriglobales bacterium]|nr:hypothetical protein [Terriglobales bacterium]
MIVLPAPILPPSRKSRASGAFARQKKTAMVANLGSFCFAAKIMMTGFRGTGTLAGAAFDAASVSMHSQEWLCHM